MQAGPKAAEAKAVQVDAYDLTYKVHATTADERVLNDALFLTGKGSLDLLEGAAAPLDKLFVTNTTGTERGI